MSKIAAERERRRQAGEVRRARRAKPREREIGGVLRRTEGGEQREKAALEVKTVTTDAEAEARMLAATIAPQHSELVAYYGRLDLAPEDLARLTSAEATARDAEDARTCPPQKQTWRKLSALAETDGLEAAVRAWIKVEQYALDELESGCRAGALPGETSPLERARFLAVRDQFIDQWRPEGGIDTAMIDMMAQSFSLYLYWSQISHARAVGLCTNLEEVARKEGEGRWKLPYQMVRDAVEEAHQMADRYNRIFLRTLRQLRDFRRYAKPAPPPSVIVNQGGQVNVASQQVNVNG